MVDGSFSEEEEEEVKMIDSAEPSKKRKKPKEFAIFGNYKNYYTYRIDEGLEDPRIKVLKKEWFEGKDCLDIGCNSGLITITIAKMFNCRKILGIDIDSDRIKDADWNLRKIVRMSAPKSRKAQKSNGAECSSKEQSRSSEDFSDSYLFGKVSFQNVNIVAFSSVLKNYDTILCLSVTKWIHLNWGDDGLITLFARIWRLLRPGGVLILEPQPWESYVKNRQVSETARTNYKNITIRPECFQEILLDKIGFKRVENLISSLSGTRAGFNRPILALWK